MRHYHVFGRTASDARQARVRAEAVMPAPYIISESGWCRAVKEYVQTIDTPPYQATFVLRKDAGC